jgi:hypothetical protein
MARAAQRAGGVAAAGRGHAEAREERVADVLLQAPAVLVDLGLHRAVELPQQAQHLLGRDRLGEGGEAHDVGEEHRDVGAPRGAQAVVGGREHVDNAR